MTIHSSLRGADTLRGERSVLTRMERIAKLQKDGRFDPAKNAVWGLPKVRTHFKVITAKKKAPEPEDAAAKPEAGKPAAGKPGPDGKKK